MNIIERIGIDVFPCQEFVGNFGMYKLTHYAGQL
jgi:hypothetical protein